VKLGVRYYFDTAIRGLDGDLADAAEVMFTRGLARAGEVGRAGFIPERDVELLTRRRRYVAVVEALLRSGLWTAVPGGYRVQRWSDWQDHLDALTRKRTADRDRQRLRRAAAKTESTLSRDKSRDVAAVEKEKEKELGGTPRKGSTTARPREDRAPPNPRCEQHRDTTNPPNCGRCADARRAVEDWHAAKRARLAAGAKCPQHRGEPADNCGRCAADRKAKP
jgi:hypothetical protein